MLYPFSIESLYKSIPINLDLEAISYWLNNKSNLVSNCFLEKFILGALEFILSNKISIFDEKYNQTEGTAMGTKYATPYTCLVVGSIEETKLFPIELTKFFSTEEIEIVKEIFKQYIH